MANADEGAVTHLMSIGTGQTSIERYSNGSGVDQIMKYINAAKRLASDTHNVHEQMQRLVFRGQRLSYSRFNVKEGMQDIKLDAWKKGRRNRPHTKTQIFRATMKYLEDDDVQKELEKIAEMLVENRRKRCTTPRWERGILGVSYRCVVQGCHRGMKYRSKIDLIRHLCQRHEWPYEEHQTEEQKRAFEDLLIRSRVDGM